MFYNNMSQIKSWRHEVFTKRGIKERGINRAMVMESTFKCCEHIYFFFKVSLKWRDMHGCVIGSEKQRVFMDKNYGKDKSLTVICCSLL